MKGYLQKHRLLVAVILVVAAALVLIEGFYHSLGHQLIRSVYEGRSLPCLNRLIQDQARRPLLKYLDYGDRLAGKAETLLFELLLILIAGFLFTLVPLVKKRAGQNVFLLILVLGSAVLAAELILKHAFPVSIYEITFENFRISSDPNLVIEPRPGAGEFNSDGLRDREYAPDKPAGTVRVLVIGDSLAYGHGVRLDDTYAKQLERKLNARTAGAPNFEVLNLGVPGYRAIQVVERLKKTGLKYAPDLIIYGHWLDDVTNSGFAPFFLSPANISVGEQINRIMTGSRFQRGLKHFLLGSQIVRRLILAGRELYRRTHPEPAPSRPLFSAGEFEGLIPPPIGAIFREFRARVESGELKDLPGSEAYYKNYTNDADFALWNRALKDFSEICRERKIPGLLLLTPVLYEHENGTYRWAELNRFITEVARCYSIPVLDLTGAFEAAGTSAMRELDLEHPNENGHRLIAEKLYEWISRETEQLPRWQP